MAMSAPLVLFKFPVVLLTPIIAAFSGASSSCRTSTVGDVPPDGAMALSPCRELLFREDLVGDMSLSGILIGSSLLMNMITL